MADQVIVIFAGTNGFADQVPIGNMGTWQSDLLHFMESAYAEIGKELEEKRIITEDNRARLTQALETFRDTWSA